MPTHSAGSSTSIDREHDRPTRARAEDDRQAREDHRREVISSWSLAKVTIEPAKETEPTNDRERRRGQVEPRVVAAGVDDLLQLEQRDERGGATADAVEQRHHLRHLGHLHRRAPIHATDGADRDRDQDQRDVVRGGGRQKNGHAHATTAAPAPIRLPLRAVFGPESPLSARMKQTAATR